MKERIIETYNSHSRRGTTKDGFDYFYICPNPQQYPHQWFWDSCFHIMVNSRLGRLEDAEYELKSLLHYQKENGFIGHMIYWEKKFSIVDSLLNKYYADYPMSSIIQPAFIAHALKYLVEATEKSDKDKAISIINDNFDAIRLYYDYLYNYRIFDRECPLLSIIHPWESGMDNSPAYDEIFGFKGGMMFPKWMFQLVKTVRVNSKEDWVMKKIDKRNYFVMQDILVNCVYCDGLYILADLAKTISKSDLSEELISRAKETEAAMLKEFYCEEDGMFYPTYRDKAGQTKQIKVKSVASFAVLNNKNLNADIVNRLITEHLNNPSEFKTPYPIPSVSIDDPQFNPEKSMLLWRGPAWVSTNWYAIKGLENQVNSNPEVSELAKATAIEIKSKTLEMVDKSGLWEHYNPNTGDGFGAKNLGWAALVYDLKNILS